MITTDFPPETGGIQVVCHRLATELGKTDQVLVTAPGSSAPQPDGESFQVRRIRVPSRLPSKYRLVLFNVLVVARSLLTRADIVVSMHVNVAPAAAALATIRRVPMISYIYGQELVNRPWLTRYAIRRAARTVSISQHATEQAAAVGCETDAVELIHPGVDLPESVSKTVSEVPTIVTVARLVDRYKGHDMMLQALVLIRREIPDVRWLVIGDGPLRPELEAMASELGVRDAVEFRGRVSDAERDDLLAAADVFAMPSRMPPHGGGEGFGIVYLEAGARGLPVVGGNVGGALDAVVEGETGLLVDPDDAAAIAAALLEILSDRALAERLGENGREWSERHAWPEIAAQVRAVLVGSRAAG